MGNASSKQTENESLFKELEWIKAALIALSHTSKQLLNWYDRRDKRKNCLRNIETSYWILKQHLNQTTYAEMERSMEMMDKYKLAQHLDTIFKIVHQEDQADEAANDDWQYYAAATAAACTKELLGYIN
ncbi:hypothetical protein CGLO_18410 [Colletotrichum gloeosporioides Cg-14]|uniref:Uncharacterized protein n=1 Tax=Colletotrichum gloeosporioides (strain Cg-14) TaxID=1237896 RepID=T0JUP2_COLGC|nr:hypothetical protein CGLO_18410 [Colletotrichum gloeosporioides Cg-14]